MQARATRSGLSTGDTSDGAAGIQVLQNDGTINVVGTTGLGSTTATFSAGDTNLTVAGSGRINVYGNANVVFEEGVGVSGSQTVNFVAANGDTDGSVTEADATFQDARIAGFLAGDTLVLQNLGSTPDSETVVVGNGYATVNILDGDTILDYGCISRKFRQRRLGFHFFQQCSQRRTSNDRSKQLRGPGNGADGRYRTRRRHGRNGSHRWYRSYGCNRRHGCFGCDRRHWCHRRDG